MQEGVAAAAPRQTSWSRKHFELATSLAAPCRWAGPGLTLGQVPHSGGLFTQVAKRRESGFTLTIALGGRGFAAGAAGSLRTSRRASCGVTARPLGDEGVKGEAGRRRKSPLPGRSDLEAAPRRLSSRLEERPGNPFLLCRYMGTTPTANSAGVSFSGDRLTTWLPQSLCLLVGAEA